MYWSRFRLTTWSHSTRWVAFGAALGFLALGSCTAPPLFTPTPTPAQSTSQYVAQNLRNKVDVLFMVDNSNSMAPMALELQQRFGEFFQVFQDLASRGTYADLNIGVVTSDYGAGPNGFPGLCDPAGGGQGGRLQRKGAAAGSCEGPVGANFIHFDFKPGGTGDNLPTGQNLVQTFTCMASVVREGDPSGTPPAVFGCGFEHVLESTYAALKGNINENQGFLRDDALLAVVFVTNEDDCSAPPDSDLFNTDINSQFGYTSSYRCVQYGLVCNGNLPPYAASGGPLNGCGPGGLSAGGRLYDVQRYIDLFTKPRSQGGVKDRPDRDVILVGLDGVSIDTGAEPVQVLLSNPSTSGPDDYAPCSPLNPNSSPACVPVIQRSCRNLNRRVFFGDPPVRINSVIRAATINNISSICADDYTPALQSLGRLIVSQIEGGCIRAPLYDPANPECVVEQIVGARPGENQVTVVPRCSDGGSRPCWRIEPRPSCATLSPDGLAVIVEREGTADPNTDVRIECRTRPQ